MTEAAREAGFTNEVGLGGTIQFLKNIVGLWIVQECCRSWQAAGQSYSYDELAQLAKAAGSAKAHINVDDPRFLSPGQMPEKVAAFCRETNQPAPESPGQIIRTVLESLALFYARTLAQLEKVTGRKYETLHIVGGGSRNDLLNQLTASAAGITVMAGPVEATAGGNILSSLNALDCISVAVNNLDHERAVCRVPTFVAHPRVNAQTRRFFRYLLRADKSTPVGDVDFVCR